MKHDIPDLLPLDCLEVVRLIQKVVLANAPPPSSPQPSPARSTFENLRFWSQNETLQT